MEMDDQILQHVMNVQTQLLQQMVNLQRERNNNNVSQPATNISTTPTGAFGTPLPGTVASPVTPPPLQGLAQPGTPFMSVNDPTRYGTYGAPYQGYWGRQSNVAQTGLRNFISGSINEINNFDATQRSKENTEAYFAHQSRGLQEQTVNMLGGAINGATTVGSFLIPGGLAASLALGGVVGGGVGFATNAMVSGAKTALDYQELLQKQSYKFINAFESTSDMGGIGMGLKDRQEISGFLRDLAPEKYLKDSEMMKVLDGAANNNLLKSVSDVDSFKKKFTEIVDTVKSIAVTMNQSLEEATNFMGEMERRGISTKDMGLIGAQSKVLSSFLGISANQGSQLLMQTTDSIVQNTSLNYKNMYDSSTQSSFVASQIEEEAKKNKSTLYNYIKNSGGVETVGPQYEQSTRGYVNTDMGKSMLLGLFTSGFKYNEKTGEFEVDDTKMEKLINGSLSREKMLGLSQDAKSKYSDAQLFKLQETAPTLFNDYAKDSSQMAQFMKKNIDMLMDQQADANHPIDEEIAMEHLGIANGPEDAKFKQEMIEKLTDPKYVKMLRARNLKEEQDSKVISESPGFKKRFHFWVERNLKNPFGDGGQGISDATGSFAQNYQKFITGTDDLSVLGGNETLENFDENGLKDVLADSKKLLDHELTKPGETDLVNPGLDDATFDALMSQVQEGKIKASDLQSILKKKGGLSKWRASLLKGEATGGFKGYFGLAKANYYIQRGALEALTAGGNLFRDQDDFNEDVEKQTPKTFDILKEKEKELKSEKTDLNQQLNKLMVDDSFGTTDADKINEIEKAIKSGKLSDVRTLTGNNREAVNLANQYHSLQKDTKDFKKESTQFDKLSRYTYSMTETGNQLAGILNSSGAFDNEEIDSLLGDLRDHSKKIRDQIKKGDISATGMAQYDSDTLASINKTFGDMVPSDLKKLTKYLNDNYDAKLNEKNVNIDKLQDFLMTSVLRDQHISEFNDESNKGKKVEQTSKAATKAAEEHQLAFESFLTTYQLETKMLKDAVAGRPITKSNSSSISTPRYEAG